MPSPEGVFMSITRSHIHVCDLLHDDEATRPELGPTDVFVKVTSHSQRGSGDQIIGRFLALMLSGVTDELVGEIVAVGASIKNLVAGDRVVVPATVRCKRVSNFLDEDCRVLRVPSADRALMKVPPELHEETDEKILFLYRRRLEWLDAG
jgi:NADPH:quinone reductase-like Zn-dependent oxidoreductase